MPDGDVAGLSPFAMPPAADKTVVISCANLGEPGRVDVPAEAARLLAEANRSTRIARIRISFMRNGFVGFTDL